MLFTLVIGSIILILIALLFAPIVVCLDTDKKLYYIQLKGLFIIYLEANKTEILRIKVHTLFRNFYFYPLQEKEHQKKR